jgi:HSP20 family molecular chaperone IbpA
MGLRNDHKQLDLKSSIKKIPKMAGLGQRSMSQSTNFLSRWLRSRQLLTDSGYGVANALIYPFYAVESLGEQIYRLAVIMPPCDDDQLSIQLDGKELVITAVAKDQPQHVTCEHRFRLQLSATIAGANWERGNLVIELITNMRDKMPAANQLVQKHSGSGSWLEQQTQRAA